jgi:hypothetical protein
LASPKEVDPALYAITVLRWYAGEEPEPDYRQFGITYEQHVEVTELIDGAVANCGGYVPAHPPLTDADR